MFSLRLQAALAVGTAVLSLIGGCASGSDGREPSTKAGNAAPPPPAPVVMTKKENLPDLPSGAGEMDPDAPEEFTRTKSGLYYRILRKSKGRKPREVEQVVVHYRGWLKNGKQFDSSYDRGEPLTIRLNKVVPGWTEGLQLIGVGEMIELEIPPGLGYGAQGNPDIPPNSTLHFLIELKEIK